MSSNFRLALELIRQKSNNTTELGATFEKMVKVFLEQDSTQNQQYEKVWHYSEWASNQAGFTRKDIGIDLVAKIRGADSYCAIQCKCYQAGNNITKEDIDSFISAASNKYFSRLLLIDTSSQGLAPNAQQVLDKLDRDYQRIQTAELDECRIDWLTLVKKGEIRFRAKHGPRPHQLEALEKTKEGFEDNDRGRIIMACGTGKTYTSLIIAESICGSGKKVLYMVPSLSLMSQTIREWKNDAKEDFIAFSACSDKTVGSRNKDDEVILSKHDLAIPATTNSKDLAEEIKKAPKDRMIVVFSTYHSIDVISDAQYKHKLDAFDLIICDEAHRTTGETLVGEDESTFVKIHSDDNVKAKKRLYMTATPRIYADKAKTKADDSNVALASMNDEAIYGPLFFHRGFGWAVENNLLTDYKVVILAVDEGIVSEKLQNRLAQGAELKLDDATKIIGCFKALAKDGFKESDALDFSSQKPMRRALAFCQSIKLSKLLENEFVQVVNEYRSKDNKDEKNLDFHVDVHHVDGSFDADLRNERLNWLKDDPEENICRVLTNVRCLSEGVDVPALDAVIFMHPRKSQIDVVQSVGRVMRKADNKDLGYVIIPITVAPGVTPEKALNDNEKYKVVWQILNALRSHDERFDSTINKLGLGEDVSKRIEIIGVGAQKEIDSTTAVVGDIRAKKNKTPKDADDSQSRVEEDAKPASSPKEEQMGFVLSDLSKAIKAKIVERCGTRDYWENWARDIAKIAQTFITIIQSIVYETGTIERKLFEEFLAEIRDDLNPSISDDEAVEMLAQHMVTKPVFDVLFKGHKFTEENPVSKAMQDILTALSVHNIEKEGDSLEKFYESVKRRASDIETSKGRQTLILELYDRFFSFAFKKMTERLGIVYTPLEVVDFILHSIEDVLNDEFGSSITNKNVNILDPFVGTGTFITELLLSGLIKPEDLKRKFDSEIHANEIVLLAYYIASINAESVYQEIISDKSYRPFNGIVLTDTFQLYEEGKDMIANLLPDNSKRRKTQKDRKINVIIGNPPYSAGQKSANDDAANIKYPNLDERILSTYAANSTAKLKISLYDSYIRAFRLASDRIGDEGVIGFVTGGGWIDGNATDGMRKCLAEEFDKIYVFNLRGNARTSGELRRKESGNVFGGGSRTPIAVTILVKKKGDAPRKSVIHYCDIGDYYDRDEKLALIRHYGSISGITKKNKWEIIRPDAKNDWINKGEENYDKLLTLNDKKDAKSLSIFRINSLGIKTNRDAWNFNFSNKKIKTNVTKSIDFYNSEVLRIASSNNKPKVLKSVLSSVSRDPKFISWDLAQQQGIINETIIQFNTKAVCKSTYRPFTKMYAYIDKNFNNSVYNTPKLFSNTDNLNYCIVASGMGAKSFSCLAINSVPSHHFISEGRIYPRFIYNKLDDTSLLLDYNSEQIDAISSETRAYILEKSKLKLLSSDDLMAYIYGILHSLEFRSKFKNSLSKEATRVPILDNPVKFNEFIEAGKKLFKLHLEYETVKKYSIIIDTNERSSNKADVTKLYRVESMKFAGTRGNEDKTTVIYNDYITIKNIPIDAYEYVVNGKPALEWVMDRQGIWTDKDSGIVNDANDYANETMNNPAYPLELFQRVITVSLETMKIVRSLPSLDL